MDLHFFYSKVPFYDILLQKLAVILTGQYFTVVFLQQITVISTGLENSICMKDMK